MKGCVNMNKLLDKIKFGGTVTYCMVKSQLLREDIILMSAGSGLYQGLKYGGSFKRGLKGGLTVWVTVSAISAGLTVLEKKIGRAHV